MCHDIARIAGHHLLLPAASDDVWHGGVLSVVVV